MTRATYHRAFGFSRSCRGEKKELLLLLVVVFLGAYGQQT